VWIAVILGGLLLTAGNVVVTVRLWRSEMFERSQQIAQTAMLWLIPGSAIVVTWFLREPSRKQPSDDPTYSNDGATNYGLQGVDIHGDPPAAGTFECRPTGRCRSRTSRASARTLTSAATPRAAPVAPRGRGTLEGDLGVRC
jgi:hypothetical protein